MLQKGRLLVQENFIGIGMGVSVLALRGEILAVFQHERVHEPLFGGGSSYRKSVSLNTELFEATSILVSKLNYTGVAMMEFKQNPKNGSWVFIEINPRFWGSLPLAVASGVDFPLYLYQMLVEGRRVFPKRYKKGIYCRNLINDIRWNWENFKADRSDPTLMTKPLPLVAGEVFNILTGRERIDSFTFDDIIPGFAEFAEFAPMIRVLRAKLDTKILENRLSMGLHAAHAKHRFKKAKCILIISKANFCRSPFAYYYLANICDKNRSIFSAGYHRLKDHTSTRLAMEAAEEFGIDMHRYHSQMVTLDMVKAADIIFVFDWEDYITIMEKFAGVRSKLFLLGSLGSANSPAIQHKSNFNVKDIKAVYKRITKSLDILKPG
jgi:protein-tyrosine-phosphatase